MFLTIVRQLTVHGFGRNGCIARKISSDQTKGALKKLVEKKDQKKIKSYVLWRYVEYVKNYDRLLESKFPTVIRVYRVFYVGVTDFYADLKRFVRIFRALKKSPNGFGSLLREEIELYVKMPKDMLKVAPVLLISALPFANYVVFPLAYIFPRMLLTSHFWSIQQRSKFAEDQIRERLGYHKLAFRCLQGRLTDLYDADLFEPWSSILGTLGSGSHPSVTQLLECRDLFVREPYGLDYLYGPHVRSLVSLHGLHRGWRRRRRLADWAMLLREMDMAIVREGGALELPTDALRHACFLRGLNPANVRREDLISWLDRWVFLSEMTDSTHVSFLLHCPILLAYNEPSNWVLRYSDSQSR